MVDWLSALVLLFFSLLVLFKAGEKSIQNAIALARLVGMSEFVVGFLLVSVSTSLPELAIAISSALDGSSAISLGNVFGANLSDVLLVVGASAVFGGLVLNKNDFKDLVLILLGSSLISLVLVLYTPGRLTGVLLLLSFLAYVYYLLTKKKQGLLVAVKTPFDFRKFFLTLFSFAFFILLVLASSKIAVDNAVLLSGFFGVSELVLGATLISLGTTLPELSVSVLAARQGRFRLALGNAVGSSIVNLSLVFGTTLALNPVAGEGLTSLLRLIVFSVIANIFLLYLILIRKKIDKKAGFALIFSYVAFLLLFIAGS